METIELKRKVYNNEQSLFEWCKVIFSIDNESKTLNIWNKDIFLEEHNKIHGENQICILFHEISQIISKNQSNRFKLIFKNNINEELMFSSVKECVKWIEKLKRIINESEKETNHEISITDTLHKITDKTMVFRSNSENKLNLKTQTDDELLVNPESNQLMQLEVGPAYKKKDLRFKKSMHMSINNNEQNKKMKKLSIKNNNCCLVTKKSNEKMKDEENQEKSQSKNLNMSQFLENGREIKQEDIGVIKEQVHDEPHEMDNREHKLIINKDTIIKNLESKVEYLTRSLDTVLKEHETCNKEVKIMRSKLELETKSKMQQNEDSIKLAKQQLNILVHLEKSVNHLQKEKNNLISCEKQLKHENQKWKDEYQIEVSQRKNTTTQLKDYIFKTKQDKKLLKEKDLQIKKLQQEITLIRQENELFKKKTNHLFQQKKEFLGELQRLDKLVYGRFN